ncbi:hypothetical protein FA13DRAFT_1793736 [Coprinellus micaceus]|uniref:Uncharacterized protein n=1 Tax=Coprinellus micaceus TaxID=71717 RepID=A0A4Y7T4N0_COPMI|nr:hypothetical protein FA13DRAFT_1793736 [Coprinellus micaceus]
MGSNLDKITHIMEGLRSGQWHLAQELLVVAFFLHVRRNYGARVVLVLPICKRGSFEDAALLLEMLRQAWKFSPYGEATYGPIWSIASDGDPKRRPALYLHCMTRKIEPEQKIYEHLGYLKGFNLWTGSNLETQDLDWKHCIKRICNLLCTREGMLVNDTFINKPLLSSWLSRLSNVDWSEDSIFSLLNALPSHSGQIHALLNPKDPQDVPRAVKLLSVVPELRKLDQDSGGHEPIRTPDT